MPVIEIDFDVFKKLTMLRRTEADSYNDVLRRLVELPATVESSTTKSPTGTPSRAAWISKGVKFPHGTEFRATYKGSVHSAEIQDGRLVVEGNRRATSLSHAARLITDNAVDGWTFWDMKRPGDASWIKPKSLRDGRPVFI